MPELKKGVFNYGTQNGQKALIRAQRKLFREGEKERKKKKKEKRREKERKKEKNATNNTGGTTSAKIIGTMWLKVWNTVWGINIPSFDGAEDVLVVKLQ